MKLRYLDLLNFSKVDSLAAQQILEVQYLFKIRISIPLEVLSVIGILCTGILNTFPRVENTNIFSVFSAIKEKLSSSLPKEPIDSFSPIFFTKFLLVNTNLNVPGAIPIASDLVIILRRILSLYLFLI